MLSSVILSIALVSLLPNAFADSASVSIPAETSVPGCEETNECFSPNQVTIDQGGEVTWSNDDTAAHTVTSGTPSGGFDGNFDSGLLLADSTFSVIFDDEGTYPYVCIVHPWMIGTIIVQATEPQQLEPVFTEFSSDKSSYEEGDIIKISGHIDNHWPSYPVLIHVDTNFGSQLPFDVSIDSNGDFETQLVAGGDAWSASGTYTLGALHISGGYVAYTNFEYNISEPKSEIISFDIDVNTDPSINYGVTLGTFYGITSQPNTDKIYITVRDPDGEKEMNILRVSDSTGYFDYKFDIGDPSVLSKEGTYTATAHIYTEFEETFDESEDAGTFIVTFENVFPEDEPEVETEPEITYLSTDQSSYVDGETVRISGHIKNPTSGVPITLQVIAANGNIVVLSQLDLDYYGNFDTELAVGGPLWQSVGTYTVKAIYSTESVSAETTFEIIATDPVPEPDPVPNPEILVYASQKHYEEGEIIVISGNAYPTTLYSPVSVHIFHQSNLVDIAQVEIGQDDGRYATTFKASGPLWQNDGTYTVRAMFGTAVAETSFEFTTNTPPPPNPKPLPTRDVIVTPSSSVPGCEESNSCYFPSSVHIDSGDIVTWHNEDSAAHTVTSGASYYPESVGEYFDSSLFMPGSTFSVSFDSSGAYPYFCIVHPWMTGEVIVDEDYSNPDPKPTPVPEPDVLPTPPAGTDVILRDDSSVPGCEESNSCFIPFNLNVDLGEKVVWFNQDSAAHTVTSGNPADADSVGRYFDSGLLMSSKTYSHEFEKPGQYDYFCIVHPWMLGSVTVSGSEPSPPIVPIPTPIDPVSQDDNELEQLIEDNRMLREELERQGEEINELNQEVDYLKNIIESIQGFFGSIFG